MHFILYRTCNQINFRYLFSIFFANEHMQLAASSECGKHRFHRDDLVLKYNGKPCYLHCNCGASDLNYWRKKRN